MDLDFHVGGTCDITRVTYVRLTKAVRFFSVRCGSFFAAQLCVGYVDRRAKKLQRT
jgi:hypothetical protein